MFMEEEVYYILVARLSFLTGCIERLLPSHWLRAYLCLERKYKFLVTSLYHIYVKPSKNRLNFIKLKMGRSARKEFIPACGPHWELRIIYGQIQISVH